MTREQQYGMIFRKVKEDNKYFKAIDYRSDMDQKSPYYSNGGGQSLDDLDKAETKSLISYLDAIISVGLGGGSPYRKSVYWRKYFTHDSFYIDYNYSDPPTVTLFETYTVPMVDFKELLEEWLAFLQS